MRFEALNQLFKQFAASGTFRNTCFRCADFWSIRNARERLPGHRDTTNLVEVVRGSSSRTYVRDAKSNPDIVTALFAKLPRTATLAISWITAFKYQGTEFTAGTSWISAIYNGRKIFGAIPKSGAFLYNGRYYVIVHMYPYAYDGAFGLPTSTVPLTFTPEVVTIALGPRSESVRSLGLRPVSSPQAAPRIALFHCR